MCKKLLICLLVLLFGSAEGGVPSLNDIFQEWEQNYGNLEPYHVEYTFVRESKNQKDPNITDVSMSVYKETKFGDKITLERTRLNADGTERPGTFRREVFDGMRMVRYDPTGQTALIRPDYDKPGVASGHVLGIMLANVPRKSASLVSYRTELEKALTQLAGPDQKFIVTVQEAELIGEPCYRVDLAWPSRVARYSLWFAHQKGMLVLRYTQRTRKNVVTIDQVVDEIACSDGLWYPKRARKLWFHRLEQVETIVIAEFEVGYPVTPDTFRIVLPEGTMVFDKEYSVQYIVGEEK